MVKRDNHTNEDARAPRVVKASELHKRKAPSQSHAAKDNAGAQKPPAQILPEDEDETKRTLKRKRVERTKFSYDAMAERNEASTGALSANEALEERAGDSAAEPDGLTTEESTRHEQPVLKVIRGAKPLTLTKGDEERDAASAENTEQHSAISGDEAESQGAMDSASVPSAQPAAASQEESAAQPDEAATNEPTPANAQKPEELSDESNESSERESVRARRGAAAKPKRIWPKVVAGILALIVLVSAIIVGVFVWNRSYRYDDAADLQGLWYVEGSATPITIDGQYIYINPDVKYSYQLNTADKTLTFSFGKMEGQGRYWFTDDRMHVVLIDGEGYTGTSTLLEDAERAFGEFISGGPRQLPTGENVIVLSRTPVESTSMTTGVDDTKSSEGAEAAAEAESDSGTEEASGEEDGAEQVTAESAGDEQSTDAASGETAQSRESASSGASASSESDNA